MDEIVNGSDIIIYVNKGTTASPTWAAVAYSTSHKYSGSSEMGERAHKDVDNPMWPEKYVKKQSVTITVEALVTNDDEVDSWDLLNTTWKAGLPVQVKYAPKDSKITAGDKYEQGMFIITSLERNDPTNEDSTLSATLESSGAVTTETYSAS